MKQLTVTGHTDFGSAERTRTRGREASLSLSLFQQIRRLSLAVGRRGLGETVRVVYARPIFLATLERLACVLQLGQQQAIVLLENAIV